jgi:hypothetical protein
MHISADSVKLNDNKYNPISTNRDQKQYIAVAIVHVNFLESIYHFVHNI